MRCMKDQEVLLGCSLRSLHHSAAGRAPNGVRPALFLAIWTSLASMIFGCNADIQVQESPVPPEIVINRSDEPGVVSFSVQVPSHVAESLEQRDDLSEYFMLFRYEDSTPDWQHPLFVDVGVGDERLTMSPQFPLLPGQRYLAVFEPESIDADSDLLRLERTYSVPASDPVAAPKITAIYPTATELPANHLKFYIEFSEPMQQGQQIFEHFKLVDLETGKNVPRPFRHTELWSADEKRLTLWFHPGRQKTGVNLNVEIGPILEAGRRYRLVIDGGWKSRSGNQLGEDFHLEFTAEEPDHHQPELETWKVTAPRTGTAEPVMCEFGEPMDWALLHTAFRVFDAGNQPIQGEIRVANGEATWQFLPQSPWMSGQYTIEVDEFVEDLAGNSLERPFEVDLTAESPKSRNSTGSPTRQIVFRVE